MVDFTSAHKADDWTEIGGGSDGETWNREGSISGQYISKQQHVGQNDSNMYTLKTDNGNIGVWGSTVLDSKFESVTVGSLVKIEALGKPAGKNYYDYKVFTKAGPTVEQTAAQLFPGSELAQ